jgi:MFS family permease
VLHQPRDFLLIALVAMGLLSLITIPLSGHLSDRIGRKRMYIIGAVVTAIYGFIYFGMLNSLVPALMFLAIMLSWVPHDMMYGPQAALIAECFTPRPRYSGSSIGYQLASITAGGPARLPLRCWLGLAQYPHRATSLPATSLSALSSASSLRC